MGVYISKMITPVKNYFSDFWMAVFGLGPRMQETLAPVTMMIPPIEEDDHDELEVELMIESEVAHIPADQRCTHCRGTGLKKAPARSTGAAPKKSGPQQKTKPKKQGPTGYAGKPEFFIEGFDKMTPDQKRAAKQAKWNEVQAARAARGQKPLEIAGSGFEDCIVTTSWGDAVHA